VKSEYSSQIHVRIQFVLDGTVSGSGKEAEREVVTELQFGDTSRVGMSAVLVQFPALSFLCAVHRRHIT